VVVSNTLSNPTRLESKRSDNLTQIGSHGSAEIQEFSNFVKVQQSKWAEFSVDIEPSVNVTSISSLWVDVTMTTRTSPIQRGLKCLNSRVWFNHCIYDDLIGSNSVRVVTNPIHNGNMVTVKEITLSNVIGGTRNKPVNEVNMRFLKLTQPDCYLICYSQGIKFVHYQRIIDGWSDPQAYCSRVCMMLDATLGDLSIVKRTKSWNFWRPSCLSSMTNQDTTCIYVSRVPETLEERLISISSKGTYSALYVCHEFVSLLNRAVTKCTLVGAKMSLNVDSSRRFIYVGYMSKNSFSVLSLYEVSSHGTISSIWPLDLSLVTTKPINGLELKSCVETVGLSDSWRILYMESYRGVSIVRRSNHLTARSFDVSCVVEIFHKKISNILEQACINGLSMVFLIKSRPFAFLRRLSIILGFYYFFRHADY